MTKRNNEYLIKIPHLDYRVFIEKKKKGDLDAAAGYVKKMCVGECLMVLQLPIKGQVTAGHLVHEIIHVLQYIAEDHNMSFCYEREHLAYIAGYLFEEICKI